MDKYIVLDKKERFFKIDPSMGVEQLIEVANLNLAVTYTEDKLIELYILNKKFWEENNLQPFKVVTMFEPTSIIEILKK